MYISDLPHTLYQVRGRETYVHFLFFQGSGEVSMRLPEGRGGAVGVRGAEEEEV